MTATVSRRVLIVGGGLAGHTAAATLRAEGYDGEVTLLGAEEHPPYDRPPLSKEFLSGAVDNTFLDTDYAALDVDLRIGHRALRLRPGTVDTDMGPHPYQGLILATGSTPVRLPEGSSSPGVHELRTLADALRLRTALASARSVAIVGAGWVGAEVATHAAGLGRDVTVIDAGAAPLARVLPVSIGARTIRWYAEHGVDLRLGTPVAEIEETGVRLADGDHVAAEVVVVGIGTRPETRWLDGSGLARSADGAVEVDALLRAGPAFAVGDMIRWPSRLFADRLRVEHWEHAAASAGTAARNLLGAGERYDPVPYFWSDQFGHRIQYVGHHRAEDRPILRGAPDGRSPWATLWLHQGRLRAALTVDAPGDCRDARGLIRERVALRLDHAADPAHRLREAAA